jgi:hypothetical protein
MPPKGDILRAVRDLETLVANTYKLLHVLNEMDAILHIFGTKIEASQFTAAPENNSTARWAVHGRKRRRPKPRSKQARTKPRKTR